MKPDPETREGRAYQKRVAHAMFAEKGKTPCGYSEGQLKARDGTVYLVGKTGQIRREQPKLGKSELKRHKKERRRQQAECQKTKGGF